MENKIYQKIGKILKKLNIMDLLGVIAMADKEIALKREEKEGSEEGDKE